MKCENHTAGGALKRLVTQGASQWVQAASILLWACLLIAAPATSAHAHRLTTGSTNGISIPSLSHGQMAVIANNRAAILDLADLQLFPDETFQRLRIYIGLQYFACAWGIMPSSVEDETSPFNECSHAYLSATQALLLHMRTMRGNVEDVRSLIDKINLEMLASSAALVECRFSAEAFNTDDVIGPRWSEIPFHFPSLLAMLSALIVVAIGLGTARGLLRASNQLKPVAQSQLV